MFGAPVWPPGAPKGQNFKIFVSQRRTFKILLDTYFGALISYQLKNLSLGPPLAPPGAPKGQNCKIFTFYREPSNFTVHCFGGLDFIYVQKFMFQSSGGLFWPPRMPKLNKNLLFATPWIFIYIFWVLLSCAEHGAIHDGHILIQRCTAQHSIAPWLVSHSMYRIHIMQWVLFLLVVQCLECSDSGCFIHNH